MGDIKESQEEVKANLEIWRRAAYLYEREQFSCPADLLRRQYEMFFALYCLVCSISGLNAFDENEEAGQ